MNRRFEPALQATGCKPATGGCPALLCIDLQYLGTVEGHGLFENHRKLGVPERLIQYYLDRVRDKVLPTVKALQEAFRARHMEVIHVRVQSLTADGRDRSPEHVRLGIHAPPGSERASFLPEVAPQGDEIVINKTASGLFTATNIHYVLQNMNITDLYVVGVYTNECVSSAVRSGADLGYRMTLISDGTAAISPELHKATLLTLKGRFAAVLEADDVIKALEPAHAPET